MILAFEAVVAPPSVAAKAGSARDSAEARAKAAANVPATAIRPNDCWDSVLVVVVVAVAVDDVWDESAASRHVTKRGELVEAGTEANPLALPATAIRTAPARSRRPEAFIVDC